MSALMGPPPYEVLADEAALAERAADLVTETLRQAIDERERALFALAGGSTPRATYARLSEASRSKAVRWERVEFFFSDERCVPAGHFDSNVRMAREVLLTPLGIDEARMHAPRTDLPPGDAAFAYEVLLRTMFSRRPEQAPAGTPDSLRQLSPRLDLILLGMGKDGHTASLFPAGPELESPEGRLVVASRAPKPPHDRLSFSLGLINHAWQVLFLVSGEEKAATVARVLSSDPAGGSGDLLPAVRVRPASGDLRWLLDQAAASMLSSSRRS